LKEENDIKQELKRKFNDLEEINLNLIKEKNDRKINKALFYKKNLNNYLGKVELNHPAEVSLENIINKIITAVKVSGKGKLNASRSVLVPSHNYSSTQNQTQTQSSSKISFLGGSLIYGSNGNLSNNQQNFAYFNYNNINNISSFVVPGAGGSMALNQVNNSIKNSSSNFLFLQNGTKQAIKEEDKDGKKSIKFTQNEENTNKKRKKNIASKSTNVEKYRDNQLNENEEENEDGILNPQQSNSNNLKGSAGKFYTQTAEINLNANSILSKNQQNLNKAVINTETYKNTNTNSLLDSLEINNSKNPKVIKVNAKSQVKSSINNQAISNNSSLVSKVNKSNLFSNINLNIAKKNK